MLVVVFEVDFCFGFQVVFGEQVVVDCLEVFGDLWCCVFVGEYCVFLCWYLEVYYVFWYWLVFLYFEVGDIVEFVVGLLCVDVVGDFGIVFVGDFVFVWDEVFLELVDGVVGGVVEVFYVYYVEGGMFDDLCMYVVDFLVGECCQGLVEFCQQVLVGVDFFVQGVLVLLQEMLQVLWVVQCVIVFQVVDGFQWNVQLVQCEYV